MKTNIDNLDKHLKTLWANINDNHLGGVFDILSDAMVELNMIRMKANGAEQSSSNCNIPLVSQRSELLAFKQFISKTPLTELELYSDEEFTDLYIKANCG